MSKEVRYTIEVDAQGAIKATSDVSKGFEHVEKASDKASKAEKKKTKTSKETAQAQTALSNALNATPFGRYIQGVRSGIATTKALTGSSKALRISLLALPFVAIATAVVALFQAFRSTQEGADRLDKVMQPLKAVFQAFWGVIQDVATALVDGIGGAFKQVAAGASAIGRIFKALKDRDISALREATSDLSEAFTGLGRVAVETGANVMTSYKGIGDTMREAAEAGRRIFEIEKEIQQLRIDQAVPLAGMRREYENLRTAAGDTLLTEEERLKAADEALQLLQDIEAEEKKVLDLEIERLKLKQSLNDTSREEELELQQLIARYDELTANTERQARRIQRQRSSIVKGQQDQIQAEEEATVAFITGLEERADKYRTILKSEEELRQEAFDNEVALINDLVDYKVLSEKEAQEIIAEMQRQFNDKRFNEELDFLEQLRELEKTEEELLEERHEAEIEKLKLLHDNKILEEEEYLRRLEQLYDAHNRRLEEARKERAEKEKETSDDTKDNEVSNQEAARQAIRYTTEQAVFAASMRANSMREVGRESISILAQEAAAAAARKVMETVPWPANLIVAPIAALGARRLVNSFANFNTGGMVGDRFGMRGNFGRGDNRLIAANDNEMILNPAQQQAIGMANLARAGVPGASSRVSLDASGFNEAVQNMPKNITVTIDLDDTINKIEDRQRINADREVIVT